MGKKKVDIFKDVLLTTSDEGIPEGMEILESVKKESFFEKWGDHPLFVEVFRHHNLQHLKIPEVYRTAKKSFMEILKSEE